MSSFTTWAKDAALRAVKTGAQAAAAAITTNTATITHLDFAAIGSIAGLAAIWSVLQNLSNLKVPDPATDALFHAVLGKVEASIPALPEAEPIVVSSDPAPKVWPTPMPPATPTTGAGA